MLLQQVKSDMENAYEQLINHSILSLYIVDNNKNEHSDYVLFRIGDVCIHLVHDRLTFDCVNEYVAPDSIHTNAVKSAKNVVNKFLLIKKISNKQSMQDSEHLFVGLSSLSIRYKDKIFPIDHQLSSKFIKEVYLGNNYLDMSIHLFGVSGFLSIVGKLATPTNVLNFLFFHKEVLRQYLIYQHENQLVHDYIHSRDYFAPLVILDAYYVEQGLIEQADTEIQQALQDSNYRSRLLEKMYEQSSPWQHFVAATYNRQKKSTSNVEEGKKLIQILLSESLFSRMKLMNVFNSLITHHLDNSESEIVGVPSYTNKNTYYLLVVYSADIDSMYSREYIINNYKDILQNTSKKSSFDSENIYLLGFNLLYDGDNSNFSIQMDTYH